MKKKLINKVGVGWIPPSKLLKMLKFFCVLFFGFCMSVHAMGYSQDAKVSLDVKDVSLNDVLMELRKQTKMDFLYDYEIVKPYSVELKVENKDLNVFLNELLSDFGLEYTINKDVVLIRKMEQKEFSGQQKEMVIVGKVMDENKNLLPGATIMLKGTAIGTVTNVEGKFILRLPEMELPFYLRISFMGMDSQEFKYTGQDSVVVALRESSESLGEVVVTGFGVVDKRLSTSSITSLKMDDILVPGVNSLDQMLEGRVPGMVFIQNSGQVGATPRLRVRGTSTILGSQEPLWVVDDIVQDDPVNIDINQINDLDFANLLGNAISGLNPADIERIDILKDASATAMYGARAANGVIVVTTKKGEIGPPRVTYNFGGTITRRPSYSDRAVYLMNSQERVELSRELMENGVKFSSDALGNLYGYEKAYVDHFQNGIIGIEEFNRLSSYYQTVNTDWFKLLMRNSFSHNHTVGVSGGSAAARYNISLGYTDEQGAIKDESGKRFTALINLTTQFKGTTINFKASGNKYDRKYAPSELGLNSYPYSTSRAIPIYDFNGNDNYYVKNYQPYNIFNEIKNSDYKVEQKGVNFNLSLRQNIFHFLKFNVSAAYNYSISEEKTWYGEETHYVTVLRNYNHNMNLCPFGGELQTRINRNNNYTLRGQFDFTLHLDEDKNHYIFSSLGGEIRSSKYDNSKLTERGYMKDRGGMFPTLGNNFSDLLDYADFVVWLTNNGNTEYTFSKTNMASSFWSASYSYKNKYIFNVNGRVDFSNAFGDRSREKLNPIWSVSGKWDIKKDLLEYVNFVNTLGLRASYGLQGNMKNDQPTKLIFTKGNYDASIGKFTSTIKYFPNPDLKWEKTHSVNFEVDFSLFQNAVSGTVAYFYKKTIDAFYNKPVSDINGVSTYVVNKGNIENKGVEISLNFNPFQAKFNQDGKRGFYWRFDPQLSQTLNKLLNSSMSNQKSTKEINSLEDYLEGTAVVEGTALNSMYSFRFKSLDEKGSPTFYGLEEEDKEELTEKYRNMSKEEVYMCYLEKSGRRVPIIQGGFNNVLGYRNVQLSMNFSYSLGNKVRLLKLVSGEYSGINPQFTQNVRKEFKDRWRLPGDEEFKVIPATQKDEIQGNYTLWTYNTGWTDNYTKYTAYDASDIRVVSGNYLRLQSLTFTYLLDKKFLDKLGLSGGSFSLSGSNIFTIAHKDLKGQDPSQSGTSSLINLSVRPRYTISFNLSF